MADQQAELFDRLSYLLADAGIPAQSVIPLRPGEGLESGCGAGDLGLHPGQAKKLLAGGRRRSGHEMLEPIQTLSGFEGKEICGTEWTGHGWQ
jgi:hypothetical protein